MSVGSLFQIETFDVNIVHCCEILGFFPVFKHRIIEFLSVKCEKDPCLDFCVCYLPYRTSTLLYYE